MRFSDLLVDTIQTLWAHKLRTALTMFGITWGIISIVLMVAAGEGFRVGQLKVAERFGREVMVVFAGRTSMQAGGLRAGRRVRWVDTDVPVVQQQSPDCRHVLPELGNNVRAHSNYNAATVLATGSYPDFSEVRNITLGEGRFYSWTDVDQARRVAVLGTEVRKQLFATRSAVGETVYLNDIPYRVVGVMQDKKQDANYDGFDTNKIFVPYTAVRNDFPNKAPDTPHTLDRLLVTPRALESSDLCKAQVRKALATLHRFDPGDKEAANIWDTVENSRRFRTMTDGMKYFLGAVGITSLFLGGLGVMNVMLVAVRERTREIGLRKAVGATSSAVLRQFLIESMVVVAVSGIAGFATAFGICALVNRQPMPDYFAGLLPTWQSATLAFALLGLVAVLSAIYPARRAAAIDPIDALRYEPGG